MITSDYQSAADWVAGRAHRLEPIMPSEAAHLAVVLLDLAERARVLERLCLPAVTEVHVDREDAENVL